MLAYGENEALVKADREDKKISIWVRVPVSSRHDLLGKVRFELDAIHQTISRLEVSGKVPLPGHPEVVVDYDHLLTLEELGQETLIPEGLREPVNVKRILDSIEPERERRERQERRTRPEEPPHRMEPEPETTASSVSASPWGSGLFYLVGVIVIMVLIPLISKFTSWYVVSSAIIGGLLAIAVIGGLQLRHDERLGEKNFLTLMGMSFKRMSLLKGGNPPEKSAERKEQGKTS